jgi:hypothetical protein
VSDSVREPAAIGGLLLYKVSDAVRVLRMSRAFIYKQIKDGRLQTVKEGGATFITAAALADYVALLEREAHDRTMDGELSERAS